MAKKKKKKLRIYDFWDSNFFFQWNFQLSFFLNESFSYINQIYGRVTLLDHFYLLEFTIFYVLSVGLQET